MPVEGVDPRGDAHSPRATRACKSTERPFATPPRSLVRREVILGASSDCVFIDLVADLCRELVGEWTLALLINGNQHVAYVSHL